MWRIFLADHLRWETHCKIWIILGQRPTWNLGHAFTWWQPSSKDAQEKALLFAACLSLLSLASPSVLLPWLPCTSTGTYFSGTPMWTENQLRHAVLWTEGVRDPWPCPSGDVTVGLFDHSLSVTRINSNSGSAGTMGSRKFRLWCCRDVRTGMSIPPLSGPGTWHMYERACHSTT